MPINYDRLIAEVRMDLNQPDDNQPSDDLILQKAGDVVQNRHLDQQNTGVGWSIGSKDITTQPGQPSYSLGLDAQFGKPTRVHTIDLANRYHTNRKIDFIERQDQDMLYQGPETAVVGSGYHTAACVIFEWQNGQARMNIVPTPNGIATYRVWYETGELPEPTLGSLIPVASPFHRFFRISTSIACLGYCNWARLLGLNATKMDPERVMAIMERQAGRIEPGLLKQEVEFRETFEEYIQTAWQTGTGQPHGYGDWAEDWIGQ
jgi:hypothetical protein